MGYCCSKVDNCTKGIEVPVPEVSETKPKVPARKSTKLIKLKAFKDSTIKDSDMSTEAYLKTRSLLKQSHLSTEMHKHQMNEKMYEVKEISIRTTTNSFSTNHQLYQSDESSQFQCLNDDEIIVLILKNHYLFKNINDAQYQFILEEMLEYQIEENVSIFNQGELGTGMFLIKTGQVELTMPDKKNNTEQNSHILNPGDTFGELSLVIDNSKRNYSACSLTPLHFYLIDSNSYQLVCSQNGFYYTKQYNGHKTPLMDYLYHNPFFQSLHMNHKEDLTHLSYIVSTNKDEEMNDSDNVFVLIEGNCICDLEMTKIIAEPGAFLGIENIIRFDLKKKINKVITSITNCTFIALPLKALYEVLGMNYQFILCFQFFQSIIMSNNTLRGLINETQAIALFNEFKLRFYENGNVIYSKTRSKSNSKVIMIFDGEISYENNSNISLGKVGDQFGANMLNDDLKLVDNIISKGNSLLFECPWEKIHEIAKTLNPYLERRLNKLKSVDLLRRFNEAQLFDMTNRMISFSFLKDEVIISPKIPCEHLYFLMKGTVRMKINSKTIHKYNEGDSFGEVYLLNRHEFKSSIVATSNAVKTYSISKEYFFELIKEQRIEEAVNNKIQLEDKKIKLNDLYFISNIHKGAYGCLSLVHNAKCVYVIKSINKWEIDKNKRAVYEFLNEKNTMEELNHPFITKLVKTNKIAKWCFLLIEYTSGILLSDHVETIDSDVNRRLESALFYGGCMYQIVKYLNKRGFIHRDIKLSNFLIDNEGYLKLINVKTAKNILIKKETNTIIGTPHYMAPEVIKGEDYSFSCDYWSIGVCLHYIFYGRYPFGHKAKEALDVYKEIIEKDIQFTSSTTDSAPLNNLLELLLDKNKDHRSKNINGIKDHLFFSNFNWEKLLSRSKDPPWIPNNGIRFDNSVLMNTELTYISYLETDPRHRNENENNFACDEIMNGNKLQYCNYFEEF